MKRRGKDAASYVAAVFAFAVAIAAFGSTLAVVEPVLRPLPYVDPDGLVRVAEQTDDLNSRTGGMITLATLELLPTLLRDLDQTASFFPAGFVLEIENDYHDVNGLRASRAFLDLLGVVPSRGRWFEESDLEDRSVVISHALWGRLYNFDPLFLGGSLTIEGQPSIVVGVPAAGLFLSGTPY